MLTLAVLLALQTAAPEYVPSTPLPMTVSEVRADIDGDGNAEIITLQLISGRRFLDDEPSCASGEKFEGRFAVVVNRLSRLTTTPLDGDDDPLWLWTTPFSFQLSDYNHDGLLDFNLGTYGTCRGWQYLLFTITRDGHVRRLPVTGGTLFNGDRANATYFPLTARGFRNSFADPDRRVIVHQYFRWDSKNRRFYVYRLREDPFEIE